MLGSSGIVDDKGPRTLLPKAAIAAPLLTI